MVYASNSMGAHTCKASYTATKQRSQSLELNYLWCIVNAQLLVYSTLQPLQHVNEQWF